MNKIHLKDNIWIEGFDSERPDMWAKFYGTKLEDIIYTGKTSNIPNDVANKSVIAYYLGSNFAGDYENSEFGVEGIRKMFATSKEAIQSVCTNEYCLIYKIN